MDSISNDKRFKHAASNPLFKKVPRRERKVKIDKRFQSMFTDKRFKTKFAVDERGRKVEESQTENYKRFYDISDSSSESDSESDEASNIKARAADKVKEDVPTDSSGDSEDAGISLDSPQEESQTHEELNEEDKKKEKLREATKEVNKYIDEIHKKKLNSQIREKLTDFRVDYARGIGTLVSEESSSSDESSSDESDTVQIEHPWGELDKDADETNEITSRLAVCNMDWDRVTAKDLMVLFHSFLPTDGVIESITIYPSEFGIARMAEEELKGPKELVEIRESQSAIGEETEEGEEGSAYQTEKLREYQLKRLKYFYAVIECNSKETANTLYTECDGMEYESSAMKLDLRFISDDTTFEREPRDRCTILPDLKKYKPRLFVNTALQQGKVDLTWDETDPNRIEFTKRMLAGEEVDDDDLQAFVAASSTEEEEEETEEKGNEDKDNNAGLKGEADRIKKYRDLVASLQDTKSKKRGDVEMEVTWGVDASSKKDTITNNGKSDDSEGSSEDFVDSEDEENKRIKQQKNIKALKKKPKQTESEEEEEKQRKAELELLLADDNPEESGLKHFSLKEIQKQEKHQKKKKKWQKKKKTEYQEEDTFKIDTTDERFSSIYTSHQFNIDPADPHFRKTKAMEKLVEEKLKRRKIE